MPPKGTYGKVSLGFCFRDVVGFEGGSALIPPVIWENGVVDLAGSTNGSTGLVITGVFALGSTRDQQISPPKTPTTTRTDRHMHFQDIISTPNQIE